MIKSSQTKFLVVRRDNIGDLVCTTPVFSALRREFPTAFIAALVNSYNRAILEGNPNIDQCFAYTKAKHRGPIPLLQIYWRRWQLIRTLRKARFSHVIVAGTPTADGMRMVRYIKPGCIIRSAEGTAARDGELAVTAPLRSHETTRTLALLKPLGIQALNEVPVIYPQADALKAVRAQLTTIRGAGPLIGIHISARKPSQRWPTAKFATLIRELQIRHDARFILLWSPGSHANKQHPGDDEKASELTAMLGDIPAVAMPTPNLNSLVAALSACDHVICSDGGAMHMAAALRKPIVCLFGDSDAQRWHPVGTSYRLLQPDSLDVGDITVADVLSAYKNLGSNVAASTSEPCSASP